MKGNTRPPFIDDITIPVIFALGWSIFFLVIFDGFIIQQVFRNLSYWSKIFSIIGAMALVFLAYPVIVFWRIRLSDFIYKDYLKSALTTFCLSAIITPLAVYSFGFYSWIDIPIVLLLFFYFASLSFGTFTYYKWKTLDWTKDRLTRPRSEYKIWNSVGRDSKAKLKEIALCSNCLSLVGLDDDRCWRCNGIFECRKAEDIKIMKSGFHRLKERFETRADIHLITFVHNEEQMTPE